MFRKGSRRGRAVAAASALFLGACAWQQAGYAAAAVAAVPVAVSAPEVPNLSQDEIDTLIYERQQVMIQLNKDTELLGDIVAGMAPAGKLAETTRAIAKGAKESHASFQNKVAGGRAKPEVWSQWADYSKRLDAFVISTEQLAKIGETGSVSAVLNTLGDALPCKQCHDVYREPKKP